MYKQGRERPVESQKMRITEALLVTSLVCSGLINIPQLYKTWHTHDVESFSVYTIMLRITNCLCWVIYASLMQEWIILSTSGMNVVSELTLLVMKWMWWKRVVVK